MRGRWKEGEREGERQGVERGGNLHERVVRK